MAEIATGTKLEYALENSGISIENGDVTLALLPGKAYEVGKDIPGGLAGRLIGNGTLKVINTPAPAPAPAPEKTASTMPKPEV